jgi:hypothetical protein
MYATTRTPWYWCKTCKKKTRHKYLYAYIDDYVCEKMDAKMRTIALKRIGERGILDGQLYPDMIVFDPSLRALEEKWEDEDRTLRIGLPGLPGKVYVKADNYGSPAILSEEIGHEVTTPYLITIMMAEDW